MIKRYTTSGFMIPDYHGQYIHVDHLRKWLTDHCNKRIMSRSNLTVEEWSNYIINELFKELK